MNLIRDHPYIILRQQNDWMGGSKKWPVLYICWHSGWVKKLQNQADVIYGWFLIALSNLFNSAIHFLCSAINHFVPGGSSSAVQCLVMFFISSHCRPPLINLIVRKRIISKGSQSDHSASSYRQAGIRWI